ncbi:Uncharacterized short protein YbdD, DUF466 family [Arboricoccus pini]|uniref:Uncharacterized short protein YbdD, DUF466 family n=1 Tax=Arboricoccus pini TaxID=1963835 RepID=A0A212QQT9_9PROT|nr:CstA-like transporter-associated (seleno)protein [Arboricoccus pini]SNB61703.1 Uncharacterized short protein YbdD, DUF466 family [Arboricoccus pini]
MNCLCNLGPELGRLGRRLKETANLMIGIQDYETYVAHQGRVHPERPVLSKTEFFRLMQSRRYADGSGRGLRCC